MELGMMAGRLPMGLGTLVTNSLSPPSLSSSVTKVTFHNFKELKISTLGIATEKSGIPRRETDCEEGSNVTSAVGESTIYGGLEN
ncbi:unnamed protein product [Linum trigynum]|uniref:Uncharacterized protein n=1 Tax=Linum trigynum TaxID=586398 RepID=A0AAV2CRF3_9ROSI